MAAWKGACNYLGYGPGFFKSRFAAAGLSEEETIPEVRDELIIAVIRGECVVNRL